MQSQPNDTALCSLAAPQTMDLERTLPQCGRRQADAPVNELAAEACSICLYSLEETGEEADDLLGESTIRADLDDSQRATAALRGRRREGCGSGAAVKRRIVMHRDVSVHHGLHGLHGLLHALTHALIAAHGSRFVAHDRGVRRSAVVAAILILGVLRV